MTDLDATDAVLRSLDPPVWLVTARDGERRGGLVATFVNPASIVHEMPRVMTGAYPAWERARTHIHAAWTRETDPANLQPRVSLFNSKLAEFLQQTPPEGVEQVRLDHCVDAILAPCSRREENYLREVFGRTYPGDRAKAKAVVEAVEELGLEPFQAPQPLPPIRKDDIHLVCWMAVEGEGARPARP